MTPDSAQSPQEEAPRPRRFLRMGEVEARVGLNKRTIQRMVKVESFPAPVNLHLSAIGFVESEVEAWMDARIGDRK